MLPTISNSAWWTWCPTLKPETTSSRTRCMVSGNAVVGVLSQRPRSTLARSPGTVMPRSGGRASGPTSRVGSWSCNWKPHWRSSSIRSCTRHRAGGSNQKQNPMNARHAATLRSFCASSGRLAGQSWLQCARSPLWQRVGLVGQCRKTSMLVEGQKRQSIQAKHRCLNFVSAFSLRSNGVRVQFFQV